jgi:hypothetical protein
MDTRKVIDAAIQRTTKNTKKVNIFRSDPDAAGITDAEIAGYQALAGTAHGAGVLRMLEDYPKTMRNLRIGSFRVTMNDQTKNPQGVIDNIADEYNILIELVKVETP